MGKIEQFEVLVVYSAKIATSAAAADAVAPFSRDCKRVEYNYPYAYLLEECGRQNLRAALTTSGDIRGPGWCSSWWKYENKEWTKHQGRCFAPLIFDKFAPVNERQRLIRELFFSDLQLQPFNDAELFSLFFDKHKMYHKLAPFSVPTVKLTSNKLSIARSLKQLRLLVAAHPQSDDFSRGVVIKDRFGAGGINIYKLTDNIAQKIMIILQRNPKIAFIAQPFVQFDQGFRYKEISGAADIRLIYQDRKIVQTYIRMAKPEDFRCNEHQGGTLTYTPLSRIPGKVIRLANRVAELVTKKHALFALDFIISNQGNVYLLEGNTGPGLDWNLKLKRNEIMAKKLIRIIVDNLSQRSQELKDLLLPAMDYPQVEYAVLGEPEL